MKILVITGILPVPAIEYKKTENDILLVTEDEIIKRHQGISFQYIFTFPYANKMLSKISLKWKSYYVLKKKKKFVLRGRELFLLPVFLLPKKLFFRNFLSRISILLHQNRIEKLINDFKPTIIHAQDADTAYIDEILGLYNIHEGGVFSSKDKFTQIESNIPILEELYNFTNDRRLKSKIDNLKFKKVLKEKKYYTSVNYIRDIDNLLIWCKLLIKK